MAATCQHGNLEMKEAADIVIIDPVGRKAGMDEYDRRLADALTHQGKNVVVCSDFEWESGSQRFGPFFSDQHTRTIRSFLLLLFNLFNVLRTCRSIGTKQAIVHVFSFSFTEEFLLRGLKRIGIRTTAIVHDADSFLANTSVDKRKRILQRWCDDMLVHNDFTATALQALVEIKLPISVIPHGHYLESDRNSPDKQSARSALGIPTAAFCPLFFGMIKPTKGLDTLLDALAYLPADTHLLVAGRPRGPIQAVIERLLKIHPSTTRIGHIAAGEVEQWFAAADVIVLPYTKSYQSGVAIQAMSRSLPVIISDLQPHAEWIGQKDVAVFFRTGDAKDLAAKILGLKTESKWATEMTTRALRFLEQEHDWKRVAAIICNLPQHP